MSYKSFRSTFESARLMNGSISSLAEIVRTGDIDAYVGQVASIMSEWYVTEASDEAQTGCTDKSGFSEEYGKRLRKVAEKRRETVLCPWGVASPVRLADFFESISGLMEAVTNPIVVPVDVYRSQSIRSVIVHFPYQGFLVLKRDSQQGIELRYVPYQHTHLHLRNFNRCDSDRRPELRLIDQILFERYGDLKYRLSAAMIVRNGWLIAQKLGTMLTVTHQEGGDPDNAAYTEYGPFYPLDFFIVEAGGRYDFENKFEFVTCPLT